MSLYLPLFEFSSCSHAWLWSCSLSRMIFGEIAQGMRSGKRRSWVVPEVLVSIKFALLQTVLLMTNQSLFSSSDPWFLLHNYQIFSLDFSCFLFVFFLLSCYFLSSPFNGHLYRTLFPTPRNELRVNYVELAEHVGVGGGTLLGPLMFYIKSIKQQIFLNIGLELNLQIK